MFLLKLAYAVLLPLAAGYLGINLILSKQEDAGLLERLALGYCLGTMLLTLAMEYLLTQLHIPITVFSASLPLLLLFTLGLFHSIKNKLFHGFKLDFRLNTFETIIIIILLIQVAFVFSAILIKPVVGVDAWANYSLRAKAFYIEKSTIVANISETGRGNHVPLIQTWAFLCLGQWNDIWGKIMFPFYFPALLIMFYFAALRKTKRKTALLGTLMLATLPFLVYHATLEYCDLMIAIYLFAGVSILLRWSENISPRYLILGLIFMFSTITIKNEAFLHLLLILPVFACYLFSRKMDTIPNIKQLRYTTISLSVLGGCFLILKAIGRPELALLPISVYLSRIPSLIAVFGDYMFIRQNWNICWFILILLLVFNYQKFKQHAALISITLLELFGFMFFYLISNNEVYNWLFFVTPAVRNMLQFMPIMLLLLTHEA